jgi:hypothetical protein
MIKEQEVYVKVMQRENSMSVMHPSGKWMFDVEKQSKILMSKEEFIELYNRIWAQAENYGMDLAMSMERAEDPDPDVPDQTTFLKSLIG